MTENPYEILAPEFKDDQSLARNARNAKRRLVGSALCIAASAGILIILAASLAMLYSLLNDRAPGKVIDFVVDGMKQHGLPQEALTGIAACCMAIIWSIGFMIMGYGILRQRRSVLRAGFYAILAGLFVFAVGLHFGTI